MWTLGLGNWELGDQVKLVGGKKYGIILKYIIVSEGTKS